MKRYLILIPVLLLLLLNACGRNNLQFQDAEWTRIAQMQTERARLHTQTPTAQVLRLADWINAGLDTADGGLERTLVGNYRVESVNFQPVDSTTNTMAVQVRCEGANDLPCNPYHMFSKVILAARFYKDSVLSQVPRDVNWLYVNCFDRDRQIAQVYIYWPDVVSYLNNQINGAQLASRVGINLMP